MTRSPALAIFRVVRLATLKVVGELARRNHATTSTPTVTLMRALETLMQRDGIADLLSMSSICKVWFDSDDLKALCHLANIAVYKTFPNESGPKNGRALDMWLPAILSDGKNACNSLSIATTPRGVFIDDGFFVNVVLPVAKAVYALPCETIAQYETLCALTKTKMWLAAVHDVVMRFFDTTITSAIAEICDPKLLDAEQRRVSDEDSYVRALVEIADEREALQEEMDSEIAVFISSSMVRKFARILLSVRLRKLNRAHRDTSKLRNYRA